ncbi:hypothetical protein MTR67_000634 [Solanum verrucosum]|uniref:Uncharacterized protein n=1 Tax=Solanum verrucosum TaxID=315347 RepID=A0AAF0PSP3_SOLVR|nr:hypothetical protein MTR67_000634 [Solanum verrucosum]
MGRLILLISFQECPRSDGDRFLLCRDEFDRLEHGSISVSEYEARLYELSCYAMLSISTKFECIRKLGIGTKIFCRQGQFNGHSSRGRDYSGRALAAAGDLPLALFAGVADALDVAGAICGLPLAPFVGAADALGSVGAAGGLPLDLFAGPGDALGAACGLHLDHFAGPGDALSAAGGLPLDLFVKCLPSVCAFYKYSLK